MSATFVGQLRSARPPIELGRGTDSVAFRVQALEMWEAVRVVAPPSTTVAEVKQRAVSTFFPDHPYPEDFVLKLRGWEMLDERETIGGGGIVAGSTLLLTYRRRRPVR
jgi:hypothetical protein